MDSDIRRRDMTDASHKTARLFVIGTGPGDVSYMAPRARALLNRADAVAGYTTYIDLIKPAIKEQQIISTGMKKEVERVEKAIDTALSGKSCALISGGDSGIYAMAGLVFELCQKKGIELLRHTSQKSNPLRNNCIEIEVVPGIPALAAGAALVGAPLTHDFAVVSLSDLLTPWETIEKRLHAAGFADYVIVIYNPKSKKRDWQLKKAQEILCEYRDGQTPVGIVTAAMREDQDVTIVPLNKIHRAQVGMQTILFIGNSTSARFADFMYTPRGYAKKYDLKK